MSSSDFQDILAQFRLFMQVDTNFMTETELYYLLSKTSDLRRELDKYRLSLAGSLCKRLDEKVNSKY